MIPLLRIGLVASGLGLAGLIAHAALQADLFVSFSEIGQDPWGLVAIVDLYIGFVMFALVIWFAEPRPAIRAVAILPMFVLGNLWAVFWLAWRLPRLVRRLRGETVSTPG